MVHTFVIQVLIVRQRHTKRIEKVNDRWTISEDNKRYPVIARLRSRIRVRYEASGTVTAGRLTTTFPLQVIAERTQLFQRRYLVCRVHTQVTARPTSHCTTGQSQLLSYVVDLLTTERTTCQISIHSFTEL